MILQSILHLVVNWEVFTINCYLQLIIRTAYGHLLHNTLSDSEVISSFIVKRPHRANKRTSLVLIARVVFLLERGHTQTQSPMQVPRIE